MREKMVQMGLDPASTSLDEMGVFLRKEQERYAQIIKAANIRVE